MMIDTHCHLSKDDYDNLDVIISHMDGNIMIASGYDLKSNLEVIELCNNYDNIYGTIGYHPTELDNFKDSDLDLLKEQLKNPKIIGIGEIGLDYHYDNNDKKKQKEIFIKQIAIANELKYPIVIHSRDAALDTYEILKDNLNTKAIMHCYSYSLDMAHKFISLGIYLGIGGVLTFKNSIKLREVVDKIDIDRLVLETDSPYLTPVPFRGSKNEPYNIYYVASKIAEIKNISLEDVFNRTSNNAIKIFNL